MMDCVLELFLNEWFSRLLYLKISAKSFLLIKAKLLCDGELYIPGLWRQFLYVMPILHLKYFSQNISFISQLLCFQ
jgi:hypothetical protein